MTPVLRKPHRWLRRLLLFSLLTIGTGAVTWTAIHRTRTLGPLLADTARAIVGPRFVAWAEDVAYSAADRINQVRFERSAPKTFWSAEPSAVPGAPTPAAAPKEHELSFPPPSFGAPFVEVATPVDGRWSPFAHPNDDPAGPVLWRAQVHPDRKRTFAVVAVVAIDLSRLQLHLMAGTKEPAAEHVSPAERPGLIPANDTANVVAAFNGGFKATHGQYGMMVDGRTFLPPRETACTLMLLADGSLKIGTWSSIKETVGLVSFRQMPPCLVERGSLNEKLEEESNRNWGSTVSGDTIIRRSAVGLDKTQRVLFYALGDAVSAQSMARAMKAAGAEDVAQLDVNFAYPRFVLLEPKNAERPARATTGLIPGLAFDKWDYIVEPGVRDFFYLTRKDKAS